jgi:lysozyme family protein
MVSDDITQSTLEERKLALDQLKEQHDYDLRSRDLELRRAEGGWATRLFTPLTTTVLAGILTFAASAVGTLLQSQASLNLEREKFRADVDLEQRKEQHELILKMVSVSDEKQAKSNLRFLAETGLIDASLAGRIEAAKDTAVLPSPGTSLSNSREFQAVKTDDDALDLVISWEGGFVSVDGNPQQSTNGGITLDELSTYLGRPATVDDLKSLSHDEIKKIYRRKLAPASGIIVPIVRAAFLNLAVWTGTNQATTTFQAAAAKVSGASVINDGVFGPQSIAAINAAAAFDPDLFVENANCLVLNHLKAAQGWSRFGPGWLQRLRAFSPINLRGVCPDLAAVPADGAQKDLASHNTAKSAE